MVQENFPFLIICLPLSWLTGCLLVLYSVVKLSTSGVHDFEAFDFSSYGSVSKFSNHRDDYKQEITLFSSFSVVAENSSRGSIFLSAINSWRVLSSAQNIVLLGTLSHSLRQSLGNASFSIPDQQETDRSFLGNVLFHSLVARARSSKSRIAVVTLSNVILLRDISIALAKLRQSEGDWIFAAAAWTIASFPFNYSGADELSSSWQWLSSGNQASDNYVSSYVRRHGIMDRCKGPSLVAWNVGPAPLSFGPVPPFVLGGSSTLPLRWLLHEAIASGVRAVVDVSQVVTVVQVQQPTEQLASTPADGEFEPPSNEFLAQRYGSFGKCQLSLEEAPLKLARCAKPEAAGFCLERTSAGSECAGEGDGCRCGSKCSGGSPLAERAGRWLALEELLARVASRDRMVVVVAAARNYLEMLMSFVCALRRLRISSYVVCALDEATMQFGTLQGLPVFRGNFSSWVERDDCWFGTECFQKVTKQKSQLVLHILRLGYHVLFSDVDIYWFRNPIPELSSMPANVLVAQSDQFNDTGPGNDVRRLNSGFYFAHSCPAMIGAFGAITEHASRSNMSEQPSFYDVLCGEDGRLRVGESECDNADLGVRVHFLSRDRYPNGRSFGIWERNASEVCAAKGCVILHNNWVNGRKRKLSRQIQQGLWEYDSLRRTCVHGWMDANALRIF